ncbi:MAG TPA: hypothetical protein VLJ58_14645, partial [Ramlibacter sp.]|nr:hypothetical protein [Ramlibacter sp.]
MNASTDDGGMPRAGLGARQRTLEYLRLSTSSLRAARPDEAGPLMAGLMALELKDPCRAAELFAEAIAVAPEDPLCHCLMGRALRALRRPREALASLERALGLWPGYAEAHNQQGHALSELGLYKFAVLSFTQASRLAPERGEILRSLGEVLAALEDFKGASAAFEAALAADPALPYARGLLLGSRMQLCDWEGLQPALADIEARLRHGQRVIPPFTLLTLSDSVELQRLAARAWYEDHHACVEPRPGTPDRRAGKIRIGYFGADFHAHALMTLLAGLFEHHDRSRFELHAFSFGPRRDDPMRRRILRCFDHFHEVGQVCERAIVRLARQAGIDIAVDLSGYTGACRPDIFELRAAPVQAAFACYAGTTASDQIDYLVADATVVPEDHWPHYSEHVVHLPHSYLGHDREAAPGPAAGSRSDHGLPATGTIFCCFNSSHKITPSVFDIWMRILGAVDGSVLWLYSRHPQAAANLRLQAQARHVSPQRLVFAAHAPAAEHLARHRLADLFLDTHPYNAHTTAIDALWAGLPVLTCLGSAFAGRAAASALLAAGLPELVTGTPAEFEHLAVA